MKMREMLRCLVCGRSAWPTMLAAGQMGSHRPEALQFVRGRGKGKGIEWSRRDLSRDAEMLKAWLLLLRAVFRHVRSRLEALGERPEDLDALEMDFVVKAVAAVLPRPVIRSYVAPSAPIAVKSPVIGFYRRSS